MSTLFISDLHLETEKPELTSFFLNFLAQKAQGVDALYILGDFFEVWVGDDEQLPLHETIAAALNKLAASGTAVYLMNGNRDFLLGEAFAERCGATLLGERHRIDLYGRPTLLMHGDSLCTRDAEYQKFRSMSRNPQWQAMMLGRPLKDRQLMARQLRQMSMAKNQGKPETIMDVTPEEVIRVMDEGACDLLIHGHTHRPARHEVTLTRGVGQRVVLGDWHRSTVYAEANAGGIHLHALDATSLGPSKV
ncbi:MAG: UDP-2,3-diacylglucosamine diphosphatase [Hahellaceae bacterium]|nr:UDP-2,3-diacylglucosamine diphosphatase [Hahellaceae bacterium]